MQFGRFHGIALLALGAVLLFVQTWVIFRQTAVPGESAPPAQVKPAGRGALQGSDYLPGLLGIALAGAGAYVLARASQRGELARIAEERRREDRSFGGEGHHVSTPTIWKER